MDQGFDIYDADVHIAPNEPTSGQNMRPADETTEAVLKWLAGSSDPFFLFVHYFDPHGSRSPSKHTLSRKGGREGAIENYYREVRFVDDNLDWIFNLENTVIVITADHGEQLWERGIKGHAFHLYEQEVRIPLIVYVPWQEPGIYEYPVSSVDIFATVLGILGIPAPEGYDGINLFDDSKRVIYSETQYPLEYNSYAFRHGDMKFIKYDWKKQTDECLLFDVKADPGEKYNLATGTMDGSINMISSYLSGEKLSKYDHGPEVRERLKSLGYVE